ncbi:hypothetical protein [Allokutzneria sp. NRRL B-24872]|uniref:hypothetical protein n=1 Tax=Allokutzneria sp. NRRL B-24872 TaxID=1137961 RepID=UPI000A37F718|nr:hypothetical protein [Allokutzneria sp. NRRL B-24872]
MDLRRAIAVVAVTGLGTVVSGIAAEAAEKPKLTASCSKAGFTGSVAVYGKSGPDGFGGTAPLALITKVQYKIKKPGGGRTERNDVFVHYRPDPHDPEVSYLLAKSGDKALADNKWHSLSREIDATRTQHPGIFVEFIFNTAGKDPRCTKLKHL